MAETALVLVDRVELCRKGLEGIYTIAEYLGQNFDNDVQIGPAAAGLSILVSSARDHIEEIAEELHNHRPDARTQPDPLVELKRRLDEGWARYEVDSRQGVDAGTWTQEIEVRRQAELNQIEDAIAATKAVTAAGAAAQLRLVLEREPSFGRRDLGCFTSALAFLEARS